TATLGGSLVLVQAAPGAVLLGTGQRVVEAFDAHGTLGADRLGLAFANFPLRLTLTVGAEKEYEVLTPARGIILPAPAGPRAGDLPTYLRHESTTLYREVFRVCAAFGRFRRPWVQRQERPWCSRDQARAGVEYRTG